MPATLKQSWDITGSFTRRSKGVWADMWCVHQQVLRQTGRVHPLGFLAALLSRLCPLVSSRWSCGCRSFELQIALRLWIITSKKLLLPRVVVDFEIVDHAWSARWPFKHRLLSISFINFLGLSQLAQSTWAHGCDRANFLGLAEQLRWGQLLIRSEVWGAFKNHRFVS